MYLKNKIIYLALYRIQFYNSSISVVPSFQLLKKEHSYCYQRFIRIPYIYDDFYALVYSRSDFTDDVYSAFWQYFVKKISSFSFHFFKCLFNQLLYL